ncbi:hypothetical protein H257_16175 [Aphanomyces astaci]|uniref:Uncharacterized protein n=1 Tax=Aphanomyces astaci TaxID=112090 RepID=W4FJQ0_APHAT|nr:hypothetical protein H257_16175 [Aphanomyces astaci]ETV67710.1 hypothetical protein H257_16175 [Aphanomyces astaci]|eukprot:XP_009842831.1 hypothetical protein H257_16175 [Aphanomyces astaci]
MIGFGAETTPESTATPSIPKFSSLLTSLKHCGSWDIVAAVFKEKSATFSKGVTGFLQCVHPFMKHKYIDNVASKQTMELLRSSL